MAHEVEEQQAQIPTAKPIFTQIYSDVITHYYQRIANIYLAIFWGDGITEYQGTHDHLS